MPQPSGHAMLYARLIINGPHFGAVGDKFARQVTIQKECQFLFWRPRVTVFDTENSNGERRRCHMADGQRVADLEGDGRIECFVGFVGDDDKAATTKVKGI
jgi:hypothetical protein